MGLAATATGLGLGAAEVLARVLAPERPLVRLEQFTRIVEDRHKFHFEDVFQSDPDLFWRLAPGIRLPDDAWPMFGLISNEQGVREDHEIPSDKNDDEIRILFLGDSCTFGYRLAFEDTYVQRTEALLREKFPGVSIDCINAGVPGYTLFQGWRLLEARGFRFQPDLVVLSFGWNEIAEWDGIGDPQQHDRWKARTPPRPLRSLRLCRLLWQALHDRQSSAVVTGRRPRLVPHEFRAILEEIDREAQRRGIGLLLLVWPSTENLAEDYRTPMQLEQFRFGEGRALGPDGSPAVVDGIAVMRAMARRYPVSQLYQDAIHTTAVANGGIAEAVAGKIAPWLGERIET